MDKEHFKILAEKYSRNECNAEEKVAVEAFFEQMQYKNIVLAGHNKRGSKILQRIYAGLGIKQNKAVLPAVWRVAAVFALLIGAGLFALLYRPQVTMLSQVAARGEKKEVTLSDGSIVVLNSGSSISYPETFGDTRNVGLQGEAYFKVFRNPKQPFIVATHNAQIKVLGTSFNINAFKQNATHVSVLTGKVEVSAPNGKKVILVKDQQVTYTSNKGFKQTYADSNEGIAWTKNIISLQHTTLNETARILENWYDVTIELQGEGLGTTTITGKFKDEKLENVLESIAYVKHLEIKFLTPKHIIIRKKLPETT